MKHPKDFIGPPIMLSKAYVLARVQAACIECEDCGEHWHHTGAKRPNQAIQINIMGQIMAVRKAVYLASGRKLKRGYRVTSSCTNPLCCNPKLIKQAKPGDILKHTYTTGQRDRHTAASHLMRFRSVKITDEIAERIRQDDRMAKVAAPDYGIHPVYFNRVRRGDARRPRNMFSGLVQRVAA